MTDSTSGSVNGSASISSPSPSTSITLDRSSLYDASGVVAVITGGGTGIGLMMAKALESNGAIVYIIGRRLEVLEKAAKEHAKHGNLIPLQGDITSTTSLESLVASITSQRGYINLLINNSGAPGPTHWGTLPEGKPLEEYQSYFWNSATPDEFTKTFHTNVTGSWYTTIAFLGLLGKGNERRKTLESEGKMKGVTSQVVIISSIAGFRRDGAPLGVAYQLSKAGLLLMGKMLANMLKDYDIRSNVIAPGLFATEMTEGDIPSEIPREILPAQRPGYEEDVAGLILYLATRAGAYVNGNVSLLDGGWLGTFAATY